jgi:hypothetical protein
MNHRSGSRPSKNNGTNGGDENDIFEEHAVPVELRLLHRSLCCQMCGGLFDKAVVIQDCGHTFCSVCIRSFFQSTLTGVHRQRKKQCPSCRHEIIDDDDVDKALTINRTVQEAVRCFKDLLLKMHHESKNHHHQGQQQSLSGDMGESAVALTSTTSSTRGGVSLQTAGADSNEQSLPASSRDDPAVNDVATEVEANDRPIDTKLPRMNFSTMKRKQLLELCLKRGLPTNGTEEELKELHRRFVVKHNAELDNTNGPRTPSEVVAELMREVRAQRAEQLRASFKSKQHSVLLKVLHASGGVSSGNAKFDELLEGNFKAMIAQARARKEKGTKQKASKDSGLVMEDGGKSVGVVANLHQQNDGLASSLTEDQFTAQTADWKRHAATNGNDKENDSLGSGSSRSSSLVENSKGSPASASVHDVAAAALNVSIPVTAGGRKSVHAKKNSITTPSKAPPSRPTGQGDRKRRSPSSSFLSLSSRKRQLPPIDVDNADATTPTEAATAAAVHRSLRNRNWACTVCTFNNLSMDTRCAMCRAPKG